MHEVDYVDLADYAATREVGGLWEVETADLFHPLAQTSVDRFDLRAGVDEYRPAVIGSPRSVLNVF